MDPDSTTPPQSVFLLPILLGVLLETGVVFLALAYASGYLLALWITLGSLLVLALVLTISGRRRSSTGVSEKENRLG